jgi:hypothetical protein
LTGVITLTSGELAVNQNLTISGPGAGLLTVSGNGASRIFDVGPTAIVMLAERTRQVNQRREQLPNAQANQPPAQPCHEAIGSESYAFPRTFTD